MLAPPRQLTEQMDLVFEMVDLGWPRAVGSSRFRWFDSYLEYATRVAFNASFVLEAFWLLLVLIRLFGRYTACVLEFHIEVFWSLEG